MDGVFSAFVHNYRSRRLRQNLKPGGQRKQKKWLHRRRKNGRDDSRKFLMKKRRHSKNWRNFERRFVLYER